MVVTAHFLDCDWKLHKRIINFTKITSHNGEEIGKMVEVCLREWGIEKVFSLVVDNVSSNNAAIDYLKRRMKSENSLLFEGKYLHMRCVCHILNLIVKDGLKELDASIKPIRNSVIFIHSSPSRLNKFREFTVLAKFSITSTVPMDVKTRWNATYKMLEVALKYRIVFERMTEEWFPLSIIFMKLMKGINDMLYIESQSMQLERDGGGSGMSSAGGGLCDELFDDVDAQNEEERLLEISSEVDKYLADEIEKRSNQYFNLLEWWKGNETRYPIISMIAKDIFAIPSSTVASEATFSLGKRVVDPFRSCLSPKMVEALVCTSDWLRAEEFSFWKDPTDDDLEL
ncbi:hypothetical protein F511_27822 [Dorcoceras hygrometricum]|uniref:HAT C-terminal dimerisation domain-containing protein n=1 Tax=Dorcoceras hygrometricum TaxID=472368 RepID=A0A2Z7BZA7_9LAMI|nr:hypothetical protein F511_27822 [Dorcoceras hygrometricum]